MSHADTINAYCAARGANDREAVLAHFITGSA